MHFRKNVNIRPFFLLRLRRNLQKYRVQNSFNIANFIQESSSAHLLAFRRHKNINKLTATNKPTDTVHTRHCICSNMIKSSRVFALKDKESAVRNKVFYFQCICSNDPI